MLTDGQVDRLARAIEYHADVIAYAIRGPEPATPESCAHPADARDASASTMGHLRWTCTACGYRHEQAIGAEARG